ncbi:MAG: lasso peptide biosynthesis PqqD family chaperone [Bacteroidales bacterium]|nr:lasso peptide biosynthesis PqqD family chaperone [Bacteroidales bacterium]
MKLTVDTTIQRNNDTLTSDIDGEKVMMSVKHGEYYGLGQTGSFIWDNISDPINIGYLVELILEKFKVEKEQCLKDILPFLNDLVEKGLVIATK